jgi:hypothetical protein
VQADAEAHCLACSETGAAKVKEKIMAKLVNATIVLVLSGGAVLALSNARTKSANDLDSQFAQDGAFRDGLFLGKLAEETGQAMRPPISRWSSEQDRAMFSEGYHRGYSHAVHAK